MSELELAIVMPCLGEAATVARCVGKALASRGVEGVAGEVVAADNGSSDGSREPAAAAGARGVEAAERGYGAALLGGIAAARSRFVVMGDADDFTALAPVLANLRAGCDLVTGDRFAGGIAPGAMPLLHRYVGNQPLSFLGRLRFRSPCRDFHCGLRGFRRDAILALDLRTTGMEFASEMVVKASLHGLVVAEVPTALAVDGRSQAPKLRTWRDGWRHLRFLLLHSPRWLFLYPGALMMLLGAALAAWVLPGPRRVGAVELNVHTLLYAATAVVVGFQAVAFGLFARVFATSEGLLPQDPRLSCLARLPALELGLACGAAMLLVGVAGSLYAVGVWGEEAFGPLEPTRMLRVVVPSVAAVTFGAEVIWRPLSSRC